MLDVNARVLELFKDPARRAAEAERQEKERIKRGHLLPTHPAQVNFAFGEAKERLALDLLAAPQSEQEKLRLLDMLAESYALRGRFGEAAETTFDNRLREGYEARVDAIESLGIRRCACPQTARVRHPTNAKGQEVHLQPPIEEVFDGSRIITFTRCACGTISASHA